MAIKTKASDRDPREFLAKVPDPRRRADAEAVLEVMERVTGEPPVMWGDSMIGFGRMTYRNTTGENDWFVLGLSPRKAALTIYGVHDDNAPDERLSRLGKHTVGKGCLYVKRLADVDAGVLEELVRDAWGARPNG